MKRIMHTSFLCLSLALVLLFTSSCAIKITPKGYVDPTKQDEPGRIVFSTDEAVYTASSFYATVTDMITGEDYDAGTGEPISHTFEVPALYWSTPAAEAFNAKLATFSAAARADLQNGLADNNIYIYTYEARARDNLVGIFLINGSGWQYSEYGLDVKPYYFDMDADRELTFEEVLTRVGVTKEKLIEKMIDSQTYVDEFWDDPVVPAAPYLDPNDTNHEILGAIFDDEGATVLVRALEFYQTIALVSVPGLFD